MSEAEATLEIRKRLRRTWNTFFGRFGKLLPIQVRTVPVVLQGRNAVVCSPTASGKTEAVVAPIAEMLLDNPRSGLSVVYVSPTRALVNDLYERLADPLSELGLSVAVKTGDRPQFDPGKPRSFLLTTPEALDSLICRNPRVLENVRFLVLDELHLIDKTYRGDQLRILLRRFRHLVQGDLCRYALSATLSNPKDIAERYLGDSVILSVPGTRELEYELFDSLDQALATARERNSHKVLIFCNRRKEVEEIAGQCGGFWPEERIVVHHGKLAKRVREESEDFMRQCEWGLCVATMTLEIGVDIGDIDVVVLYGAPWSISSLIQRVGRGNRRRCTCVAFGVCRSPEERLLLQDMLERARAGEVEDYPHEPDLSVVVQQIFSCLYQHPAGLREDFLSSLFAGFAPPESLTAILSHLARLGYIEKRTGRWFASTKVMDMGETGMIHSNIPDPRDYLVIDASTGAKLGEVSMVLVENVFRIAGKAWRLARIDGASLYVVPAKGDVAAEFSRSPSKGAFSRLLPPGI